MIRTIIIPVAAILILAGCGQAVPQPQLQPPAADNNGAKASMATEMDKVHEENVRLKLLLSEIKVIADKSVPFISEVRGKFLRAVDNPDPVGTLRLENIAKALTEVSKKIDDQLAVP